MWRGSGPGREVPQRRAHAVVRAVQVRPNEVVEAVAALVVLAVPAADPAHGDERVNRAQRVRCTCDRPVDRTRSRMSQGSTCVRPPTSAAVSSSSSALEADQAHGVSVPRQPKGDRAPDPRAGPGHHHMPVAHPLSTRRNLRGFRRPIPLHRTVGKA